jgi:hypothetical protein
MLGGDIRTTLNRSLHIAIYQEFIETHLIGVALETRKEKLCDCERIIVVALYGNFFVLFLFVSLRGGHSICDKGKTRSYAILVSGVHAFRLMRFMTISVGCEVQY